MLKAIFLYELKYSLKRPAVYLYGLTFFAITFISFAGTAGFFDPPTNSNQTERLVNSPHEINFILQYLTKFFLFLLPAIIGGSLYKDYQSRIHSILYTYPLKKPDYLFGKFLSGFFLVVWITVAAGFGMLIAEFLPGLHVEKVGPLRPIGYLHAYLVYLIPNMLIHGLLVFAVVLRFRNIYAGFAMAVGLIVFQLLLENLLVGSGFLIALSDPFGQNTVNYLTQYWTLEEQNTLLVPINSLVVFNRLIWLAIASGIFYLVYRWFSFSESLEGKRKSGSTLEQNSQVAYNQRKGVPAKINFSFSWTNQLITAWKMSWFDLKFMLRSWIFLGLTSIALLLFVFVLQRITNRADMTLLPVTHLILSAPTFFYSNIILLITFIFSGIIINRKHSVRIDQLEDISPLPNWVFLLSKTWAIIKMQAVSLLGLLLAGILFQAANGYYHFEIGLYIFHLLFITLLPLAIWGLVSMFIHTLFSNVYAGMFILLLGWLGVGGLANVGISSPLLLFNHHEPFAYSDLNGYGHALSPFLYLKSYWLLFSLIMLSLANLLWKRGLSSSFKERIVRSKSLVNKGLVGLLIILTIGFFSMGADIWTKEQAKQVYAAQSLDQLFKQFKQRFSHYAFLAQPKIKNLKVSLDLFPETNSFTAKGSYMLVNQTNKPIDTLLLKAGFDEVTTFTLDRGYTVVEKDSLVQFYVLKLEQSLQPTDTLQLDFSISNKPDDFFVRNSSVLKNGTFIRQDAFIRIGYFFDYNNKSPEDSLASYTNYQSPDADLIDFEAIVSTVKSQVAIAPGTLLKTWEKKDRNCYHYKAALPVKFAFSFHSGTYALTKEQYNGVELQVFHHPTHTYNTNQILNGLKAALAYNSKHFSDFPFSSVSVVEFPNSEGSFGTYFGNIMPMSETRFIANISKNQGKINLPFYVPAHELTHHWWGNQLMPASADGFSMLTESITEYISLQVYKKSFGKEMAQQFLEKQHSRYLRGRTTERKEEAPLMYVKSGQDYIAYGKGAVAFHTLAHFWGEEKLNTTLRHFLETYKFNGPPYPTSVDLIERLQAAVPDSLRYIVADYFTSILFHTASIENVSVSDRSDDNYLVRGTINFSKQTKDKDALAISDYLEIGCYDQEGALFYTHTQLLPGSTSEIEFTVPKKPSKLIVDPNLLLIEMNRKDNHWQQ